MIVVTLRYLSGFECQFLDVSVTNLKGVQVAMYDDGILNRGVLYLRQFCSISGFVKDSLP